MSEAGDDGSQQSLREGAPPTGPRMSSPAATAPVATDPAVIAATDRTAADVAATDAAATSPTAATRLAVPHPAAAGRRFTVGKVLRTGCAVWVRNIVPFLLITALFYAPPWIWAASVANGEHTREALASANQVFDIATYLTMLLNVFVAATLTYGVVMELDGQRASIGACVVTGLRRFLPALGVGALTELCVCLASIALVVPGFIVLCMLYVATPVSVVERPGIAAALSRSSQLTQDRRWSVFALILVLVVADTLSMSLLRGLAISTHPTTIEDAFDNLSRLVYLSYAYEVITGSISAVMASVAYYYLRAEKEGISTAELAAIFD